MKSALCRTRSKIFCRSGLIRELSVEEMDENKPSLRSFIAIDGITLDAEHLSQFQGCSPHTTQCVDNSLCISLRQEGTAIQDGHRGTWSRAWAVIQDQRLMEEEKWREIPGWLSLLRPNPRRVTSANAPTPRPAARPGTEDQHKLLHAI